jgi:hypothetical protein
MRAVLLPQETAWCAVVYLVDNVLSILATIVRTVSVSVFSIEFSLIAIASVCVLLWEVSAILFGITQQFVSVFSTVFSPDVIKFVLACCCDLLKLLRGKFKVVLVGSESLKQRIVSAQAVPSKGVPRPWTYSI